LSKNACPAYHKFHFSIHPFSIVEEMTPKIGLSSILADTTALVSKWPLKDMDLVGESAMCNNKQVKAVYLFSIPI